MHRQLEDIFHHFSVVRNGERIIPHGRIKWLYEQAKKTAELEKRVEELEKENKELHQEIGKHANQVFDIANASFETGERAKQLINKMLLKGESQ